MHRVAIAGAGPAGCYAASKLLSKLPHARVDVLEKLPAPFGLVRYGVAPDHPETKAVEHSLESTLNDERVRFFGNVSVGTDVSVHELRQRYSAVVLASGAVADRTLGVPGENTCDGVLSARRFVGWYNGAPEDVAHVERLNIAEKLASSRHVAIIGLGNVSIDCARMLLKPAEELAQTDVCQHALDALQQSAVQRVVLIGRRGPAQAAYTAREVREVAQLPGVQAMSPFTELHDSISEADAHELAKDRARRRAHEALAKNAADCSLSTSEHNVFEHNNNPNNMKELHFRFLRSPISFECQSDHNQSLSGVRLQRNKLQGEAFARRVVPTEDKSEVIPCGLAIRSIGYKAEPIDQTVPFDHSSGRVEHNGGRIALNEDNRQLGALYGCGWLKRGPTGVIATNVMDAEDTALNAASDLERESEMSAAHRLSDIASGTEHYHGVDDLLQKRSVEYVTMEDWSKIDKAERARARPGAPREKFVTIEHMLQHSSSGGKRRTALS